MKSSTYLNSVGELLYLSALLSLNRANYPVLVDAARLTPPKIHVATECQAEAVIRVVNLVLNMGANRRVRGTVMSSPPRPVQLMVATGLGKLDTFSYLFYSRETPSPGPRGDRKAGLGPTRGHGKSEFRPCRTE